MHDAGDALAIVAGGRQVGFAVRRGAGYCFVATRPGFELLDGSRFGRIEAVQAAAARLWSAISPTLAARPFHPDRHPTVVPFRPAPRRDLDWCAASGWKF
ncbi:MAG TPA: hypothetical protein PKA13_01905 [Geminicoccaceae bacterium]|nr:hypothetical protein [Geminicoccus sp.]HMU48497.1 hypothetical protein [Geminicoccaceae bacterium]